MKHVSWFLALVVGAAIGFFTRNALVANPSPRVQPALPAQPAAAAARPGRPQEDPKAVYRMPIGDAPVKGPADALVTIVEVSDFECPFCKRVGPTLKQLEQAFPGQLRFAFKHNPLPFHPRALPAALATEAAREQKGDAAFWAMHDALFESAPALDDAAVEKAGAAIGLDAARLKDALARKTAEPRIKRDQAEASALGAGGTPTFFINGRKLVGAQPFEAFKAAVEEELQKAKALVAAGTPASAVYAAIIEKGATAPVMVAGPPEPAGAQAAPQPPPGPPPAAYRKVTVRPDDPSRGPADAKLTVVLFSDFQCPFCSRVEPTLKEMEQAFPGQVRVIWKHQPLPFHPNARPASLAAEAAREQGKFWQMHEKMFAAQAELSPAAYERWAKEIGLDLNRFKAAVAASSGEPRIAADQALANEVGASGTPTMFFNCRQVVGALPFSAVKPIVEEELKKADALIAKGTRRGPGFHDAACAANVAAAPAAPPVAAAPAPGAKVDVTLRADDPAKGSAKAPVTVVVFSDFQCPFCSRVEPTLKQVEQAYGDKVRIVWKHKPLPFHPHAMPAAEAAEAAREQGKFWQMHDKMFAAQAELSPAAYEKWASELGLDVARFKASIASGRNKGRIEADDKLATSLGISGTPTLVVNGEKVVGAVPYETLKAAIDRSLAAKK